MEGILNYLTYFYTLSQTSAFAQYCFEATICVMFNLKKT